MIRLAFIVFAALALSACGGDIQASRSAVDMVPFEVRPETPIFSAGRYCDGKFDKGAIVISSGEDTCSQLVWHPDTRTYTPVFSVASDETPTQYAVTEISQGVVLLQTETPEEAHAPYVLAIYVVRGGAFTYGMSLSGDWTQEAIARHPRVTFGMKDDHPYIAAGARADIAAFLGDVVSSHYRKMISGGETFGFMVRDMAGPGEHEPDVRQSLDIEALRELTKSLARTSPGD
ncbi:MAG TPA: hypothetical protein VGO52_04515 [Hyphomonadaceae bacterium]|jgi:hypothetical protein|nr:hypothetical protein [Hyphomonadaceae bacterium]